MAKAKAKAAIMAAPVAVGALALGALLVAVSLPSALPGKRWWLGVLLVPGLALWIA